MDDKKNLGTGLQIFLGIIIGIVVIVLPLIIGGSSTILMVISLMVILTGTIIWGIKLIKGIVYKPLGITILAVSIPWISILILFGSCVGMLSA